jgi:hypothetical protein
MKAKKTRLARIIFIGASAVGVVPVFLGAPGLVVMFLLAPFWLISRWERISEVELRSSAALLMIHRAVWCSILLFFISKVEPDPQNGILGLWLVILFGVVDLVCILSASFVVYSYSVLSDTWRKGKQE